MEEEEEEVEEEPGARYGFGKAGPVLEVLLLLICGNGREPVDAAAGGGPGGASLLALLLDPSPICKAGTCTVSTGAFVLLLLLLLPLPV